MSQLVKALELALHKGPPRVAMCPVCPDEPLVLTFDQPGAEFHCLACRGWFSFVDPRPVEQTPELLRRVEAAREAYAAQREQRGER